MNISCNLHKLQSNISVLTKLYGYVCEIVQLLYIPLMLISLIHNGSFQAMNFRSPYGFHGRINADNVIEETTVMKGGSLDDQEEVILVDDPTMDDIAMQLVVACWS